MIIIVEGIDRVGKTTLCNKLSKLTGIPIYKHDSSTFDYSMMDNENETDKMMQLIDICELTHSDVIFDRFHWSDYAYGILLRKYNTITAYSNMMAIDHKLARANAIIIHVVPENITASSLRHGCDLVEYSKLIDDCAISCSTNYLQCTYSIIDDVAEDVRRQLIESRI